MLATLACAAAGAWAAYCAMRMRALRGRLQVVERRESDVLEAVRVLTAASRESATAVLTALDRTLRVLDASIDAVLVFAPSGDELACVYAQGARTEHFLNSRVRRDRGSSPAAQAALCEHRVELSSRVRPIIATDRYALAIPMLAGSGLAAVVYAASAREPIANGDLLVRAVAQAASPYVLAAEREADRMNAAYDGLTGLHTPRAFREKLQEEVTLTRLGRHTTLCLWFIDTDHFKRVNDTFGHAAGDVVLQRMASLLRDHTLAGVDVVARNGGDEFCAIVRNVHKTAAIERAQRYCDAVEICDFGVSARITASIGVAAFPYDARDASELLEIADAAMYHSKRAGRGRVSFAVGRASFAVYR